MKTYNERTNDILNKRNKEKARRKKIKKTAVFSTLAACMVAFACVLFVPFSTKIPSVAQYKNSEYYAVIKGLNAATYEPPEYKNNFEKWSNGVAEFFDSISGSKGGMASDMMGSAPPTASPDFDDGTAVPESPSGGNRYEETTDNQVLGVKEGDLFKRSSTHLFYLVPHVERMTVRAYKINGVYTEEVGEYTLRPENYSTFYTSAEMYLSEDCTRLTLVCPGTYYENRNSWPGKAFINVVSLDVSDPTNIKQVERIGVYGSYVSSRMVDGKMLFVANHNLNKQAIDFDKKETFLPKYTQGGLDYLVDGEDIVCPEQVTETKYTMVFKLDEKTLKIDDCKALLSYSSNIYVSKDNLFAAHGYTERTASDKKTVSTAKTQVAHLDYSGEDLAFKGSFTVDGSIKNQYSMDEFNGVLRLVTSTNVTVSSRNVWTGVSKNSRNANLYCVSLENYEILGEKIAFAPEGEAAESVRFDGYKAYVCTAVVITFTDPVYAFDLSDMQNITCVDTGVIDGYSSNLVNFTNGHLLGIGYGGWGTLKIEIYEETATAVESVCSIELECEFSEEYKSYFIDRESGLIGLSVYDYSKSYADGHFRYVLFHFDGFELVEILNVAMDGQNLAYTRATRIENCFYMITASDSYVGKAELKVVELYETGDEETADEAENGEEGEGNGAANAANAA